MCRMIGIPRSMLLGQTPEAVWGDVLARRIFPMDFSQGGQEELELPVAGSEMLHAFLIKRGSLGNEQGEASHRFAFLIDIQHRREVERSLAEARDLAEAGSQAKSRFLTNMSHELRTPMHAILSFAEMGRQRAAGDESSHLGRYFERIENAGRRLLSLLNDLLDLSRLEADRMTYEKQRHDLVATIQGAIAEISALLQTKHLRIFAEDHEPLIAVFDRARITQVLVNLLSNAVRFSPENGSIRIELVTKHIDANGRHMMGFSVHNLGPAIAAEDMERIFESFVQGSHNAGGGTGLGLAISRRIMHDHGGSIQASNHPDGGAEFTVLLPAEEP
ncbi:MAG: hypothetical protein CGU28_13740 [Candidatus Dactylopiibacterium carminicum]|uniref:histidine kinase n=1 Tax=Candidatus Dactylopiibacterium carminicum TaxID=857335 RepID=A0A272ENZ0_9RHOO|nr:sensor histidine kinase [Candidatus Dactylopiibacterium carminicum]PAS91821.1 MAG: hypothetical protein CGU29_14280 [Candidatus Dactylopiibacterium carminicum]PAS94516.1 MAG: hypothetical protein CGU28_13740 [Candidatus Dactylopiibacterium carminicum]PAS96797.1 MAG: hypothetical protein BSR46_14835 [Candidatus Dactylopiibacterium carminicum]